MSRFFLLLPFGLLAGAAGQAAGFYFFAVIGPALIATQWVPRGERSLLMGIAGSLVGLALVFLLINLGHYLWPVRADVAFASAKEVLRVPLSSAVLFSGFFLWIIGRRDKSFFDVGSIRWLSDFGLASRSCFENFSIGMFVNSIILAVYVLFQQITGFDYRAPGYLLGDDFRMGPVYRATGFYGHPLSLAAAGLAVGCFFWTVYWLNREASRISFQPGGFGLSECARLDLWTQRCCLGVAGLHFYFVCASGGRTAAVLAAVCYMAVPIFLRSWRIVVPVLVATAGLSGFVLWVSGLGARMTESLAYFQGGPYRLVFWRVYAQMFSDRPWFGHGSVWLKKFVRKEYYEKLGFANFPRQFNAHNVYLEMLAGEGLVGTIAVAIFFVGLVCFLYRFAVRTGQKLTWIAFVVALVVNLLHGLTQNTLFDTNLSFIYLAMIWLMVWQVSPPKRSVSVMAE